MGECEKRVMGVGSIRRGALTALATGAGRSAAIAAPGSCEERMRKGRR